MLDVVPEHRRWLLREVGRNRLVLGEHRRVLRQERVSVRADREALRDERRQHLRILAEIHDDLARQRRYHKEAMAANKWLLALADAILRRRQARAARQPSPQPLRRAA